MKVGPTLQTRPLWWGPIGLKIWGQGRHKVELLHEERGQRSGQGSLIDEELYRHDGLYDFLMILQGMKTILHDLYDLGQQ